MRGLELSGTLCVMGDRDERREVQRSDSGSRRKERHADTGPCNKGDQHDEEHCGVCRF